MDIGSIKPKDIVHEVLHPGTSEPVGMRVFMCYPHDPRIKAVVRRHRDADLLRKKPKSFSEREQELQEIMVSAITHVEFDEGCSWNGETEFSKEMAVSIASTKWLYDQLDEAGAQVRGFFQE
jgi:hypothetical protein